LAVEVTQHLPSTGLLQYPSVAVTVSSLAPALAGWLAVVLLLITAAQLLCN
jgi:hypothetical protein